MTLPNCFRSRVSLAVLVLCVAPPIAAGQGIERHATPLRTVRDELGEFREAYAAAYIAKEHCHRCGHVYAKRHRHPG